MHILCETRSLLLRFVLQNLEFVLRDLDLLLELSEVLRAVLDHVHVLVTSRLRFFVQRLHRVQFKLRLLMAFHQVQDSQFLDLQLLPSLTDLYKSVSQPAVIDRWINRPSHVIASLVPVMA